MKIKNLEKNWLRQLTPGRKKRIIPVLGGINKNSNQETLMRSITEMVQDVLKRLQGEPTAPVERVVGAVTYYYSDKTRRAVLREVKKELKKA